MTDTALSTTQEGRDWSLPEEALSEGALSEGLLPDPYLFRPVGARPRPGTRSDGSRNDDSRPRERATENQRSRETSPEKRIRKNAPKTRPGRRYRMSSSPRARA